MGEYNAHGPSYLLCNKSSVEYLSYSSHFALRACFMCTQSDECDKRFQQNKGYIVNNDSMCVYEDKGVGCRVSAVTFPLR